MLNAQKADKYSEKANKNVLSNIVIQQERTK